jgi:hypothetical protein
MYLNSSRDSSCSSDLQIDLSPPVIFFSYSVSDCLSLCFRTVWVRLVQPKSRRLKWCLSTCQCCGSGSGLDPDSWGPGSVSGFKIRIRIQEGKNYPQNIGKSKYSFFIMLDVSEGFSCSLDVLYGGLGTSKMPFLIKIRFTKKFSCFFSPIFGHQNPGSEFRFT